MATTQGPHGCDYTFNDGLVVLHGPNGCGKSTLLLCVLYALGLERLLGPQRSSPFAPAITTHLETDTGSADVLSSTVSVEIENQAGKRIVCVREAAGGDQGRMAVTVIQGPALTATGKAFEKIGFVVGDPGTAQAVDGFYARLSAFIGLKLPDVPRFDSAPGPLYLECVFAMFFVEQLSGWRNIATRVPTFLRIPDPWTRTIEFLLDLDRQRTAVALDELARWARITTEKWTRELDHFRVAARGLGFVPQGIAEKPVVDIDSPNPPVLRVTLSEGWKEIDAALAEAKAEHERLEQQEVPKARDVQSQLAVQVEDTERTINEIDRQMVSVQQQLMVEQQYLHTVRSRLSQLEEDRRKYIDEFKLQQRLGQTAPSLISDACPACGRTRPTSLLRPIDEFVGMTVEENIAHIKGEIGLLDSALKDQAAVVAALEQKLVAMRHRVAELTVLLREQRRTLRNDGNAPSSEAIRRRMMAEDRHQRLQELQERWHEHLESLRGLAKDWREIEERRRGVGKASESAEDARKRGILRDLFIAQLRAYSFRSLPDSELDAIEIDATTFRPTLNDYDFGGMSASDTVRTIWSYMLALLELSAVASTNHPGILVFDEPRQQAAEGMSFAALVQRASRSKSRKQQIIFTTSEDDPQRTAELRATDCQLIELPRKVLRPIADEDVPVGD